MTRPSRFWSVVTAAFVMAALLMPAGHPLVANAMPVSSPGVLNVAGPTSAMPRSVRAQSPVRGGTLFLLTSNDGFYDMDPQRIYTNEDLAFFGATIMRSLTAYTYSSDPVSASSLVPDAATDTGTSSDGAKTWAFTLRAGMKWQDGTAVKCQDFKYGVSRAFATDVIYNGPTYAIQYLAIPTKADGMSKYPGPYTATRAQQALFDKAVVCSGNTITFHLNRPVSDFNYTVTLGFGAVPNPVDHPGADTGEGYDGAPWSDGPYMIHSLTLGSGGSLVLVRNPYWSSAADDYRPAYPDKWVVDFGLDPQVIDQRLMHSTGNDAFAVDYGGIQPQNLNSIFTDSHTANATYAGRAFSDYDPYSRYYWINTAKVPNEKIRQAMAVALDRAAIRDASGGAFLGDYADGVLKPNIGQDYAPTHVWDAQGPFGQTIDPGGDPTLAEQLIQQSGESAPTLTYDYAKSTVGDQVAAIVKQSLQAAGFTITLKPLTNYYSYILNPATQDDFGATGWGPDWPNASTVIPDVFTPQAGFDLSQVSAANYPDFYNAVVANQVQTDRAAQATEWQALNTEAADQMFVIPTFFGLAQTMAGTGVGNLYRWAPYSSWPYAQLYANGTSTGGYQPDGRIRLGTSGAFVGDNTYNTTGLNQSVTGAAKKGTTVTFTISIQNDGSGTDSFRLQASGTASALYAITYFHGTTNITAAVVGGTFTTSGVKKNKTYVITVKVKVLKTAAAGSSVSRLVTISSVGDNTKQDAVGFTGKRK